MPTVAKAAGDAVKRKRKVMGVAVERDLKMFQGDRKMSAANSRMKDMHEPQINSNCFKGGDDTLQLLDIQTQTADRDEATAVLFLANISTAQISDEAMAREGNGW